MRTRWISLIAVVAVLVLGIAWGPPLLRGWHTGYNFATDTRCETRLGLQWCGGGARSSPPASSTTAEHDAQVQREAEEARQHGEEARQRERKEEAERPRREAEARKRTERESLESEGKAP